MLELSSVVAAAERLSGRIHRTPVLSCRTLSEKVGVDLVFKVEAFQRTGSFKARGALNAVLSLPPAARDTGVVTHSSGNHGAALAWAASSEGLPAIVVMPENSLPNKISAVEGYGAEVVLCEPTLAAREATLERLLAERQATFVPPFNHEHVIAGQGTVVWELLEDVPDLDAVLVPVGGGGLLAGSILAADSRVPIIGAEPELANDAWLSLQSGELKPAVDPPVTIADGLRTGLGQLNWSIINARVDRILLASDAAILEAALDLMNFAKWVIEPSGAVGLAALRAVAEEFSGRRLGIVLSGGNADLRRLYPGDSTGL